MELIGEKAAKEALEKKVSEASHALDNEIGLAVQKHMKDIGIGNTTAVLGQTLAYLISLCDDDDIIQTQVSQFVNMIAVFKDQRDQAMKEKEAINAAVRIN